MRTGLVGIALAVAAVVLTPGASRADQVRERPEFMCPAPISTCGGSGDAAECPPGYRCACVPSCPQCRDCAAQVCVAEHMSRSCQTACDCPPGLACVDGRCIAGIAPVFCCESVRCPVGQQCQHRDGRDDRCGQQCQTACDCEPGLGCFDGQCIAGIAPVFCCEDAQCPTGEQCQHRDGRQDRCGQACIEQAWRCDNPGGPCDTDRVCACTASCPSCEDCGPGTCLPRGAPTPYRCNDDGTCRRPGDRCICVSSCAECDDCAQNVCVPSCAPVCERRLRMSSRRIDGVAARTRQCTADSDCVRIDTSSGCRRSCGAWVNQRYAERLQRLIRYIDRRYCATYRADDCPLVERPCPAERGACVDGVCTGVPVDEP